MDTKLALRFSAAVVERSKILYDELGFSLSRFTEILYTNALEFGRLISIEELPIRLWVSAVSKDSATRISENHLKSRAEIK